MSLIDTDALCNKAEEMYIHTSSGKIIPVMAVPVWVVNNAPTIEAQPVRHGKWEKICTSYWLWKPDGAHVVNRFKYKHNDCGKVVAKSEPYCPNCGAKMDLEGVICVVIKEDADDALP